MITLITGVPGAGKTLNTIKYISEEYKGSDRPVYVAGVSQLSVPGWNDASYDDLHKWRDYPKGSIFLVDEADQFAPTRGNRGEPPEYIAELARHRHYGFDFYFITQRPKMLDHHLRGLVGKHHHYERVFGANSARVLTWEQCCDDPGDFHNRKLAVTSRRKFDSKYFSAYKSAEIHTHKRKIPLKVWMVAAGLVGVLAFGWRFIDDIQSRPEQIETAAVSALPVPGTVSSAAGTVIHSQDGSIVVDTAAYVAARTPRIQDLPWSAPIYDSVTAVQTYPRPQCIYSHRRDICTCYTQQATRLDITYQSCRAIVDGGYFDPYRLESDQEGQVSGGRGGESEAVTAPPPPSLNKAPRIVYLGGNLNNPPSLQAPGQFLDDVQPVQPGAAYRNPVGSYPTMPAMPRMDSPPINP
jgi:zona occludens toxin